MLLFTSSLVRNLRIIGNCKAAGEDMENELRPESTHFRVFFRLRSLCTLAHWLIGVLSQVAAVAHWC